MSYTLDTNILIGLGQRYPRDLFPSLWSALEGAINDDRACICDAVLDELARGRDDLHDWAKKYPGFVCEVTQEDVDLAARISTDYPEWVREERNAADPFVVAHAVNHSRVIVTEENVAGANVEPRNQKVPNVASAYSAYAVKLFDWVRAEGWSF